MIKYFVSFCALLVVVNTTLAISINDARMAYEQSVNEANSGKYFLKKVENEKELTPVILGYKGAVKMVMAKHYFNPIEKLYSFKEGKNILENAIAKDPQNSELIYLRFGIQCNSPKFLNYCNNIHQDKAFLLKQLSTIEDKELKKRVFNFLKSCKQLTAKEMAQLQKIS
jgi:hypothetical protein